METKMLHGKSVELTAKELAEHEEAQATAQAAIQVTKDAEVARKANVASAKTKLQNLGLTVDEVKDAFNI